MRSSFPNTLVGVAALTAAALTGCASAGGPAETAAPAAPSTATATASSSAQGGSSPSPSAEAAAPPERITDEAVLRGFSIDDFDGGDPIVVWAGDRSTVQVFGTGSGSEACQPTGESAEVDDGRLELEFEEPGDGVSCTADLRVFGWAFDVRGADASVTTARIDGWSAEDDEITVEIRPAMGG
ncbi:hypothetical protein [Agrococcus carbonis]|uniref:Lipoprotein n=1 Tax=Agrococcus carbonis TaxID=684552 RepID=A0A1H1RPK9_9MICO|nr:hypothetical protein [Agrococcus carbonis]SDS37583.1 hypothetical protein SAMN04489719_2177 [Agrococcus carbonis]